MNIKTKLSLGLIFLFAVIMVVGGISIYYLSELTIDSKNIIKDNYESLEYMRGIQAALDSLELNPSKAGLALERNLKGQEGNVTEEGELESTSLLRRAVEEVKSNPGDSASLHRIRQLAYAIMGLNMKAIVRKNDIAEKTADRATLYVIVIVSICFLISFSFIVNFPGYIANPISQLTASIKAIANKDYEERLHFNRSDEFEELAQAFNSMAEKLDEYEHSNLANLLFEKKRIETLVNRMHDPIVGLNERHKVIFANSKALELLNIDEQDLIGRYAPDVAVTNDLLRSLIKGVIIENGLHDEGRLIKIYTNKKESYFEREIIPISFNPTGEKVPVPIGTVILLKNVTSFKELDLAKTNFIATISHELKTPIASLQMGAKLLLDNRVGALNDEQAKIVNTVSEEANRLMKITSELLDLAQVETGNIKIKLQSTSPDEIVEHAFEAVKFQAEQRHVNVDVKLDGKLPNIRADKDKTTWVLINLLTNALRHSAENSSVVIRCQKEKEFVRFSVKDFGMGIDPKYKERLFDRFYQVPDSTKKGTGLGLSISKEFIESQGGSINVESELGSGSEFSFLLPLA